MDLQQRIERLERQNQRLKLAVVLVIALVGGLFLLGRVEPNHAQAAQGKKVVEADKVVAEKFVLIDGAGKERAVLRTANKGTIFIMSDGDDDTLVNLTTTPDMAAISVGQRVKPGKDNPFRANAQLRIDKQQPKVELLGKDGAVVFTRP